ETHQLGQHHGTGHYRDGAAARLHHLGIALVDGGGDNDDIGLFQILTCMPLEYQRSKFLQTLRYAVTGQVGTADAESKIQQHLGDAAHAGAADTDKMNVLHSMFHDRSPASAGNAIASS